MYVRLKSSKSSKHETVQIVRSVRNGDKVRQEVVASLGVIRGEEDRVALLKLANNLIQRFGDDDSGQGRLFDLESSVVQKKAATLINYKNLEHVRDTTVGFEEVFGKLSRDIGFDQELGKIDEQGKHHFSVLEIVRSIVINRLKEPESKRATFLRDLVERGESSFELHHIYRAMDVILPYAQEFQKVAHQAAMNLFTEVKSYFYDATTLFFESVSGDELKNFGFSKDCKFNQVQIVVCLLVTNQGVPVGYEVFAGNTAETKTLKTAIENLAKRYKVKYHTVVCDRGMLSKENLASMPTDFFYIVGEKLRSFSKDHQEYILSQEKFEFFGEIKMKEIPHPKIPDARLIIGFSQDRAKKDKADRERLIAKLKKRFEKKKVQDPKSFVTNGGTKKYVSFTSGSATLNLEAIAKDSRWDGFFGIISNNPHLTAQEILTQYRGLWQVEANFRVLKNDLAARPVFHWTENRIRSHILICFMALVLERHLYARLKMDGAPFSSSHIHNSLRLCKSIYFQDSKTFRLFKMPTNKPIEAKQIYTTVGLQWRSKTVELPNPGVSVVPSLSVKKPNPLISQTS